MINAVISVWRERSARPSTLGPSARSTRRYGSTATRGGRAPDKVGAFEFA